MRILMTTLALAVLVPLAGAQEAGPLTITAEALGDNDAGIVARVRFFFATPPEVPDETGLFLQGSVMQNGKVLRNFRLAVKDGQQALSIIQAFGEGEAEVEARLIMPLEDGGLVILTKSAETFAFAKTNKPFVAGAAEGAEGIIAEGVVPEVAGAVKILPPRRDVALNLFIVTVDVEPPVKRVEFFVEGKKILARNAPPYSAELDLGKLPKRVEVRAVGYDEKGRYIDADAFLVNERDTPLEVQITRTDTPDGVAHFKLSIQNPKGTNLKTVALYAGDRKLIEWDQPPYAIDIPLPKLAGHEFVRASVIDSTGYEAADLLFLSGDRFIEQIDVNLIELPALVTDATGAAILGLEEKDFQVFENGKGQKITAFNFATNLPVSVGVLLDRSGSMEKKIDDAKQAAIEFFRSMIHKNDRAFFAGFAAEATRNAPFVSDLSILEAQVNQLPKPAGMTSLYDAIVTGLYRFRGMQGRKALIVITDGDDTSSRLSWDDLLTYVRASRVPVYIVGIGFGLTDIGSSGRMRELAAETGGTAYFIRNVKELGAVYVQLEKELRSQYLLAYHSESTSKDQEYRTIEVKVDRPDAKVRTIRGFIP
ncbi:MAG TPA: VWA domain-containing protein [Thermoanaerobaculia bacterium]|nr:VWA domain-containing protein [Thermoanaerobaculia bacterium]